MITLNAYLNSLNFASQLEEVRDLFCSNKNEVRTGISFSGTRFVEVPGYKGSVSLENLVKRITIASTQRCKADNLTTAERIAGLEIVKKLIDLCKITDDQINNSNFLTRFLVRNYEFSSECPWLDVSRFLLPGAEYNFCGGSVTLFL